MLSLPNSGCRGAAVYVSIGWRTVLTMAGVFIHSDTSNSALTGPMRRHVAHYGCQLGWFMTSTPVHVVLHLFICIDIVTVRVVPRKVRFQDIIWYNSSVTVHLHPGAIGSLALKSTDCCKTDFSCERKPIFMNLSCVQ
jgi:hypothetical protein